MKRFLFLLLVCALGLIALNGCRESGPSPYTQIRERVASIRTAILVRNPEGIVRWGTGDWTFVDGAGQSYDKAAYLVRTRALLARIVSIDSLDSHIDSITIAGDTATVELTQNMERHERDPATGRVAHVLLRYHEHQSWVRTSAGWCVRRVAFAGPPERTELSPPSSAPRSSP